MTNNSDKRGIEEAIILAHARLNLRDGPKSWMGTTLHDYYLSTWNSLIDYYRFNKMHTEIAADIIQHYLSFTDYIKGNFIHDASNNDASLRALNELRVMLNELIMEAQRNQYILDDLDEYDG